jgi:CubicO group peptidase (beta-lactamase class C family)
MARVTSPPKLIAFVGSVSLALAHAALAQGPAPSPLIAPVAAPSPAAEPAPTRPGVGPELSRADLEPFLDGLINSQLENRDIAGAVVAVVREGEVLLAKGYGYADFAEEKRVSAEGTLFRPGSISKLFTALAVMQLVEAGKLDLDRDIAEYLDFEIPRNFPEPITLRRILTHTAGFEESLKNLFGAGRAPVPHRDYLIAHMPAQVYRPGITPAYSNYAISVAGYIVERLTNQPLHQYLAHHVFQPLGMIDSTFEQPLPEPLALRLSNGYVVASKPPKPFEVCNPAPAGAMSTTARDMARFMLAMLSGGTLDGATIIRPETLATMQSRQNELHRDLHAMGLGFMEYSQNGRTMWGHGGDTILFHSDMFLMPDARVGLFISYNSAGNRPGGPDEEVQRAFLERYFPAEEIPAKLPDDSAARGREVSGFYEVSRRSETNWLHVTALLGQLAVKSDAQGVLTIPSVKNMRGQPKRWREAGPYSYREIDGPGRLGFRRDERGAVTDLLPNAPIYVAQRVSGLRSSAVLLPIVGGSLAFIGATLVLWPVAAMVRRRYRRVVAPDGGTRVLHRMSRVTCLLIAGMLGALVFPFTKVNDDIAYLGDKATPYLHVSHVLGWLACAGAVAVILAMFRFWRTPGIGWWPRLHSTLLAIAVVVFLVFAWQWQMLSPSTKF